MKKTSTPIRPTQPRLLGTSSWAALAGLFCAFTLGLTLARAETEENLEKTFPAKAGGQLVVEVEFGSITVTGNASDEVSIHVTRRVTRGSKESEQAFLEERPVTFTQEGNTVTVRSKGPMLKNGAGGGKQRTEAKYVISVPSKFGARLKTAGGAIDLSELEGIFHANTSGGPLKFAQLRGPLDGRTAGGSVQVNDCEGPLKVQTSGGAIDVRGGGGALNGHTSGGNIGVKSFRGSAHVETTGGTIRIVDVSGEVHGATSGGSIAASFSSLTEPVNLQTSGGTVTVSAPSEAAFDLDASTSGGTASSELPVAGADKKSRSRLQGSVNGGGKPVVLRSVGGGVQVKKL